MLDPVTCGVIMTPPLAVLSPGDLVAAAVAVLLKNRMLAAPVVEKNGIYRGMFLRSLLITRLLPGIAALEGELDNVARILQAVAAGRTVNDLRDRYREIAGEPVVKFLDKQTLALRRDTPLMETVHLLHLSRSMLPVVDEKTGKLLGVVSAWDLLRKICADA